MTIFIGAGVRLRRVFSYRTRDGTLRFAVLEADRRAVPLERWVESVGAELARLFPCSEDPASAGWGPPR